MKIAASSAKASGAKHACVLWLDGGHYGGSCIQAYDRGLPVVVHVNRSVPGLTVAGISSATGIL